MRYFLLFGALVAITSCTTTTDPTTGTVTLTLTPVQSAIAAMDKLTTYVVNGVSSAVQKI